MTSPEFHNEPADPQLNRPVTKMPIPGMAPKYIDKMAPPTDAEIARAAEYGFDLTEWEKYYTKDSWEHRND